MSKVEQFIQNKLQQRADQGILRKLPVAKAPVDFCSNDYLGFARSTMLRQSAEVMLRQIPEYFNGATGSRLISGNTVFTEETEAFIAHFHGAEAGLLFNSGYDANVGLVSSLAQRGDTLLSDKLIHASMIDGCRLTYTNRYTFKHNDLNDLEAKLKIAKGNVYVLVESIYSMDGDLAPLTEIAELCEHYEANLIVDEAHALGIFGNHGSGMVSSLGLENKVFARVVTFGKALGCHGAIVLGSAALRAYLINFARSFIYSTAAPIYSIAMAKAAYKLLMQADYPALIRAKINLYTAGMSKAGLAINSTAVGTIHTIDYSNAADAIWAAQTLQNKGLEVRAILSPTVAKGKERLRICLHLFNTDKEIETLVAALKKVRDHE
jgi:8-amino-7-oxononanoate synthase